MEDNFVDTLRVRDNLSTRKDHSNSFGIFSSMNFFTDDDDRANNLDNNNNVAHFQANDDMWYQQSWSSNLPINLSLESRVTPRTDESKMLTTFAKSQPFLKKQKTKPPKTMYVNIFLFKKYIFY